MRRIKYTSFGVGILALVDIALAGDQVFGATFIYSNFDSSAGLILQSHARAVEGKLRLTPAIPGAAGGAWLDLKQFVKDGFDTTFQIQISEKYSTGADGLAFVIQNNPTPALGYPGCNIGYGGITNLLVVKFNDYHWPDHAYGNDYGRYDLIAVLVPHSPAIPLWDSLSNTIAATTNGVDFSDGQIHTVRLVYVPGNLQVFLDDLENPLMTVYVNLAKVMNLDDGRAWVGFTAGTGADQQNHDLISWEFDSPAGPTSNDAHISTQIEMTNSAPSPAPVYRRDDSQASPTRQLLIDPSFGYRLPGDIGPAYQIEASTNLVEWTPLTNAVFYFRDPESTNYPERFYRFPKY
jgi:hypothetical protein